MTGCELPALCGFCTALYTATGTVIFLRGVAAGVGIGKAISAGLLWPGLAHRGFRQWVRQ